MAPRDKLPYSRSTDKKKGLENTHLQRKV